jgi:RND family efflux transporter MFP subunit
MKRNPIIIGGAVILALAVVGVFGWQRMTASAATSVRVQSATVERGTLVATVNAAGNVSTPEDAVMAFQTSGRVTKVNVQVGDQVKKGQLLIELDTTDLELALKTAKANLASSQANFEATKSNLQLALRTAQANLASSQASFEAAKAKNAQNANSLIVAKVALDKATVALQKAQGDYNAIAWRGDIGMTAQAVALQNATIDYQSALANYNITASGINDTALRQAQASLDNAQVSLDQAQRNLDTSLRTAQATLDNAQVAVEQAQRNLDKARIFAPFDGYVAAMNFSVGDSAGTNPAITIVDLSQLQVKVTLAEVDMAKLKVGQTAQMTLDALAGKTYNGQVIAIGPVGTITQGVVNYPITVAITDADSAIKPGMTANLAIVVERRENVLLVPTRAVRVQGNQKTVTVMYKGQSIAVPVGTGLSNDQSIEITNGLKEGDEVVINQTQTRQPNVGGFGDGPPMFMVPGGR